MPSGITEEDKRKTTQLISQYKEGKEVYRLKEPRNLFAKLHPVPAGQTRKKLPLWYGYHTHIYIYNIFILAIICI